MLAELPRLRSYGHRFELLTNILDWGVLNMYEETIKQISSTDIKAIIKFVSLERKLLGEYPLYVSNFDANVIRNLSRKSAFTWKMDLTMFTASKGDREVARCATLINPEYQKAKSEKVGFIGYFAAAPNCESSVIAMLARAEGWLKEKGINRSSPLTMGAPFWVWAFLFRRLTKTQ